MATRAFKVKQGLLIGSSAVEIGNILDEDNMASDSATALATQQSIKAYVDSQTTAAGTLTVIDDSSSAVNVVIETDDLKIAGGANITTSSSGDTLTAALDTALTGLTSVQIDSLNLQDNTITTDSNADLTLNPGGTGDINLTAGADVNIPANIGLTFGDDGEKIEGNGTNLTIASSGTMNFNNTGLATFSGALTVTGDLTINGSTTTNSSTNTTIADNIIELNSGISSSGNDIGFIFERGSTGNNACFIWDETEDRFTLGTTTATGADKSGGITVSAGTLAATCTAAQYSDVAERYHADAEYGAGTIVELGGVNEITRAATELSEEVFGVVSSNDTAAFMMNDRAGYNDRTHPFVAMTGRVPTNVVGTVTKGARLVTSSTPGYARMAQPGEATAFNVLGRALEAKTDAGQGKVLAVVSIKI
jgi:hypothetical protein|tara:strand:- start:525 stop:1787 length:1263 start_codon:yes stop_codon:yes gene_type:complete